MTTLETEGYARGEKRGGKIVIAYPYDDENGNPYHIVERTEDKQFPQKYWVESTNGKSAGHWVYKKPSKFVPIPYMLQLLIQGIKSGKVPWITEGEKDADTLATLGLLATTNPGGAGKWDKRLNQWFKDVSLAYVLEDNDKMGRKHVAKIIESLGDVIKEIRVITFRELPAKGD